MSKIFVAKTMKPGRPVEFLLRDDGITQDDVARELNTRDVKEVPLPSDGCKAIITALELGGSNLRVAINTIVERASSFIS